MQNLIMAKVPITVMIIFLLLYLNFRRVTETLIVMMSVPFALVGGLWMMWWLGFNLSVAVAVGQYVTESRQLRERVHLPGKVVEPDGGSTGSARPGTRPDLERSEVVVVGRAVSTEERGLARHPDQRLETEHVLVELAGDGDIAHVEDSVVQAGDGHGRCNATELRPVPGRSCLIRGR